MQDYGAGPGPAVHTLHFKECASRLPAVFDFTDYGMLGGSRPGPVNGMVLKSPGRRERDWPRLWAGAGKTAVGRMAERAATAKFSKILLASRPSSVLVLLRTGA